jgi:hypothetical protein
LSIMLPEAANMCSQMKKIDLIIWTKIGGCKIKIAKQNYHEILASLKHTC